MAVGEHGEALTAFLAYTAGVFLLAALSHRLLRKKAFLEEYFLGSRGLGLWALAMSYAATSASGGSFMGFPSMIYQHGWILALWIASYMVVPITCMGMLGKRLNQVARKTGAITVPDVFRDRFHDPALGLVSSLLLVLFLIFYLVAQFKAGASIVKWLLQDLPVFQRAAEFLSWIPEYLVFQSTPQDSSYYLALLILAVAVIVYTTYGGFRAVVWTDVLQGIVILVGVVVLLCFTLSKLEGGLEGVTRELESKSLASVTLQGKQAALVPAGTALRATSDNGEWLFKTEFPCRVRPGTETTVAATYEGSPPSPGRLPEDVTLRLETPAAAVTSLSLQRGRDLVRGPGFHLNREDGFLPLALAISFFVMWAISGAGQPTTMLRLMAFKDTKVYRKAMFSASIYYSLIYIPLVIIFVSGRTLIPALAEPDDAMPALVLHVVPGFLAGIILAAPFAAVMSSVDSFLLAISSSLVRDIFQRGIRPQASPRTLRVLSYVTTVVVGCIVLLGAINPPRFLQHMIVLASAGLACTFLAPMLFSLYWKRMTSRGALAGMLGGFLSCSTLYVLGWCGVGGMSGVEPYHLAGFLPVVWGLLASTVLSILGSLLGPPPPPELVAEYFSQNCAGADGTRSRSPEST